MKLDKTPIDTPEKVLNISTENAIIEVDNLEKSSTNKETFELELSEKENHVIDKDIVVHLNNLSLYPDSVKSDKQNGTRNGNLKGINNEASLQYLMDRDLKRQGIEMQYKDIFTADLSCQNIYLVEESLSLKLARLVVLNLSHNKLSKLPELLDFKCLKELDISHNMFEAVPVCLQICFSKLVNLDVSYNKIGIFDQPMCTHTLRKLAISHNVGMKIPEWFWYMEFCSLEELDLSFSDPFLANLPLWLLNNMELKKRGVFTNLISLKVHNTTAHMDNVCQLQYLKNIKYLDCSNNLNARSSSNVNVFWEIPSCILQLRTVQELHLSSVQLNFIPEDIGNLTRLEILNVSHNKICKLPESLTNLRMLKELNVSYNNLLELPGQIGSLTNLTILHAQYNNLPHLPDNIKALNLVYCDLYNNELEEDCVAIVKEMKVLHCLDITQNYINVELIPLKLQQNLRATLTRPVERFSEPKVLSEYVEDPIPERSFGSSCCREKYSDYASNSSSRSSSPVKYAVQESQPVLNVESPSWEEETTQSDDFIFRLGNWKPCLPQSYDEAIETFRTREREDTCFIPGDTQIKFFKRQEPRKFHLLGRPPVPGQFEDA